MLQDHAKEVGYCSLDFEGFERVTNHLRYVLFCFDFKESMWERASKGGYI